MAWTPPPKRYGTPPRIRPLAPRRTISRKRRCSTGPIWRRKSDGKQATRPDRRNASRGASRRAWPVAALAVGHQPLPWLPHSCWRLARVLSHLMPPAGQGGRLIHPVIARAIIVGVFFEKECLPRRALRWRSDRIRPEPLCPPRGVIAPARFILHRTRMDATTGTGVSGAPHSPFKCDPNRENRPASTRWLTPRRAGVVHVCGQTQIETASLRSAVSRWL
jgi:hypothetical protein